MSFKGSQASVAPRVLTSWRVSWSFFLLLAVPLFVLFYVLVLRYSCSAAAGASHHWTSSTESDLLPPPPPPPVDAATEAEDAVEFFADPPRGTDGVGLRGRDKADTPRGTTDADARGMIIPNREDDERSADRLRYPGRKRVLGFVGVQTGFKNRRKRALLRETWFPGTPEEHARVEAALGLAFRFIVGHSASAEEEQLLQAENSTHGDLLRIDVDEGYLNLNHKTLVYFTALFKLYEAEFYVKADDDIYLIPGSNVDDEDKMLLAALEFYLLLPVSVLFPADRLSALIAKPRDSPRTFEPKSELLGSHYFVHPFGSIYALSYGVVQILNAIPTDGYSCLAPAWTESDDSEPPVATINAIGPLAGLRGSMDDSEAGLGGMEEAEAPRGLDEAEPRRMDEVSRGRNEPGSRGMDERGADRLRYPGRKRVLGFVDVFTDFSSRERRALLRETWFPGTPEEHARSEVKEVNEEERSVLSLPPFPSPPSTLACLPGWKQRHGMRFVDSKAVSQGGSSDMACDLVHHWARQEPDVILETKTGLVFRFIVGNEWSAEDEQMLQAENSTHGDLLRIDVDEADFNANRKTLLYFTTVFKLYEAEFYVKASDDIFLMPERLSSLIARPRKSPRTYLGCFKKGVVVTNPDTSELEPDLQLLGPQYFLHAYSAVYSLSYGVVRILNSVPKGRLRMLVSEDVTMGAWMLAFNVTHERSWPLCQNICTPSAAAVWDIPICSGLCKPEVQMKQLHQNPSCSGKEPVQPV
ncbi:unnamed protein product [Closterium sp. Naga37s-1]|nr:unnamed protein product [Closterium sp. Naga37s-1]